MKRHYGKFLIATLSLIGVALLAQNPAPRFPYSDQAELSKVEEWVLSQGTVESIAAELAVILGLVSDRLPVILRSCRTLDGVSRTFAVGTNASQNFNLISVVHSIVDK